MKTIIIIVLAVIIGLVIIGGGLGTFLSNVGEGTEKIKQNEKLQDVKEQISSKITSEITKFDDIADNKINTSECDGITVCVKEGDFITYKANTWMIHSNDPDCCLYGNLTYSFGKKIDDKIELTIKFETPKNHIYTSNGMMNLNTGFLENFSISDENSPALPIKVLPFMLKEISSTSTSYDKLSLDGFAAEIKEETRDGRDLIFIRTQGNLPIVITIDKETRIVIFSTIGDYQGHTMYLYTLIENNIGI